MQAGRFEPLFLAAALLTTSWITQAQPEQSAVVQTRPAEGATQRVTGKVIDERTGKPLAGAQVMLNIMRFIVTFPGGKAPDPPPESIPPREMTTGADGEFAFDDVPAVAIDLQATREGYTNPGGIRRDAEDHMGIYQAAELRGPLLLRLAPQASIHGVVRNSTGAPLGKTALITLWRLRSWGGFPGLEYGGWPTLDADGTYHFDSLSPGRYYLLAGLDPVYQGPTRFKDGHAFGEVPVRFPVSTDDDPDPFLILHEGEQAHIDFRLAEAALHRVTLTGSPVTPQGLTFVDENRSQYMVHEAEAGRLFEAWVPNGSYSLENGRAGEIEGPMPVEVRDSDVSAVHFKIVPADPQPRDNVSVQITSTLPRDAGCTPFETTCGFVMVSLVRLERGGYVGVSAQTGEAGRYDASEGVNTQEISLLPGTYTVAVATSGALNLYARSARSGDTDLAVEPLVIRQGSTPDPIRIELAPGGSIEGVARRGGKPGSAWVYAIEERIEAAHDFRQFQPVVSEVDGKFVINGLAPGSYLVFASTVELTINLHDPAEVDYWRSRGKAVRVEAGKPVHLDLPAVDPPDEPY